MWDFIKGVQIQACGTHVDVCVTYSSTYDRELKVAVIRWLSDLARQETDINARTLYLLLRDENRNVLMYYKKIILWIQIVIDWLPCLKQLEAMDLYIGFMVDDVSSCLLTSSFLAASTSVQTRQLLPTLRVLEQIYLMLIDWESDIFWTTRLIIYNSHLNMYMQHAW